MAKTKTQKKTAATTAPASDKIYRLKIALAGVHPPLWRQVEVFAEMEMDSLSRALQVAFGWDGSHMGEFQIKKQRIGNGTDWYVEELRPSRPDFDQFIKLSNSPLSAAEKRKQTKQILQNMMKPAEGPDTAPETADDDDFIPTLCEMVPRVRTKFKYTYDFGDNWDHLIEVEKIEPVQPGVQYPRCTDGARANPIEDCGGPWAYNDLAEAAGNPKHERYDQLIDWVGKKWDPEKFSTQRVNRELTATFNRRRSI